MGESARGSGHVAGPAVARSGSRTTGTVVAVRRVALLVSCFAWSVLINPSSYQDGPTGERVCCRACDTAHRFIYIACLGPGMRVNKKYLAGIAFITILGTAAVRRFRGSDDD
jgi:hypothetical protein